MRLTDARVQIPFANGERIYRRSKPEIVYRVDGGLIYKETNDGKPKTRCIAAPYCVEDWQADDWRVKE